jgi:hypothetical protein
MGGFVEGAVESVHALDGPDIGRAQGLQAQVVADPLRPLQEFEELHCVGCPAGDVARQFLQHGQRALAPAVVDGLGHVGAAAEHERRVQARSLEVAEQLGGGIAVADTAFVEQRGRSDQIADIGHGPRLGGFHERVFVELADVALDLVRLLLDEAEETTQGFVLLDVARADIGRKQRVELVTQGIGIGGHHSASTTTRSMSTAGSAI